MQQLILALNWWEQTCWKFYYIGVTVLEMEISSAHKQTNIPKSGSNQLIMLANKLEQSWPVYTVTLQKPNQIAAQASLDRKKSTEEQQLFFTVNGRSEANSPWWRAKWRVRRTAPWWWSRVTGLRWRRGVAGNEQYKAQLFLQRVLHDTNLKATRSSKVFWELHLGNCSLIMGKY